ncbi:methyl-accepting chemotaxis protein [Pseudomonas stutzeri]|nr:methyl-accepting chemotaxis protein [Stutzerimonas stutzeri]
MQQLLRRLSIRAILNATLVCFAVLIVMIAALGLASTRMANQEIRRTEGLDIQMVDAMNRAYILRLNAFLRIERYVEFRARGEGDKHQALLVEAEDFIRRSQDRFNLFKSAPAIEDAELERLAGEFEAVFEPALAAQLSLIEALRAGDMQRFAEQKEVLLTQHSPATNKALDAFYLTAEKHYKGRQEAYQSSVSTFAAVGALALAFALILLLAIRFALIALVVRPVNEAVGHLQRLAKADLSQPIEVSSQNEVGQLLAAMREMQDSLARIVASVRDASGSILVGAQQIATGNADLSSRTEQQAASLEETAASMDQLTATVKQNADNARQASTLASDASSAAGQGREVVGRVVETMQEINESSRQIANIIGVIDSIAFQTNILALNASVEAARAGEQGRGFAVVAGEVRNLAGRCADAAREIKALIEDSTRRVRDGSELVDQAGKTIGEVVAAVRRVTDIIDEISAASQEQSAGIGQINTAIAQMDEVTQQNASLVQEASAASASLADQAHNLEQAVEVFRLSGEQARRSLARPAPPAARSQAPAAFAAEPARRTAVAAEGDWETF